MPSFIRHVRPLFIILGASRDSSDVGPGMPSSVVFTLGSVRSRGSVTLASEEDWIRRAQRGEPEALTWLVRAHGPRLQRLFLRVFGTRNDLEDLVQTTFLELLKALPGFRHESSFATFLTGIAVRVGRRAMRPARVIQKPWTSSAPIMCSMARAHPTSRRAPASSAARARAPGRGGRAQARRLPAVGRGGPGARRGRRRDASFAFGDSLTHLLCAEGVAGCGATGPLSTGVARGASAMSEREPELDESLRRKFLSLGEAVDAPLDTESERRIVARLQRSERERAGRTKRLQVWLAATGALAAAAVLSFVWLDLANRRARPCSQARCVHGEMRR